MDARFNFAGFDLIRKADTSTHEVEIGKITQGGEKFVVHMLRRSGLSFEGEFLAGRICSNDEKTLVWAFPKTFQGLGLLAQAGEEIVIALVGKGANGMVEEIIPLPPTRQLEFLKKIELKKLAAEYLHREYSLSGAESKVLDLLERRECEQRERQEKEAREARAAALALREKEEKEAREARIAARKERQDRVGTRPTITVFTSEGLKRYGLPVVGDEWMCLQNGTFVVSVESYDDSEQTAGAPIEAFIVSKKAGGQANKGNPTPVTREMPRTNQLKSGAPLPVGNVIIEASNGIFEIPEYRTMADIRAAQAAGLNGGSLAVTADGKVKGKYQVYQVYSDKIVTVGLFSPMI